MVRIDNILVDFCRTEAFSSLNWRVIFFLFVQQVVEPGRGVIPPNEIYFLFYVELRLKNIARLS